jgi:hypothetical protein
MTSTKYDSTIGNAADQGKHDFESTEERHVKRSGICCFDVA